MKKESSALRLDDTANHSEIEPSLFKYENRINMNVIEIAADIGVRRKNTCWHRHVTKSQVSFVDN
jgi:hypothetical protein